MAKETKKGGFSVYWIYAILGVALIAFQLYVSGDSHVSLLSKDTLFDLVKAKGAKKIEIVNQTSVDFRLSKVGVDFVKKSRGGDYETIKKALKKESSVKGKEIIFQIENIGDLGNFQDDLEEREGKYIMITRINYFSQILSYILPFGIIILIWIFVMRRMSGGGGGGGGGSQIFNIGKSRAQVYDKGKSTNTTFKDVAGLAEAKIEIVEIVEFLKNPKKYTDIGAKFLRELF